ncbi:MAG: hypothetical protein ACI9FJ_001137 [Alteromonadaceae bacterium]
MIVFPVYPIHQERIAYQNKYLINPVRPWVALVDGLPYQIRLIERAAKRLQVKIAIVMDFIHVLEYLWKAAWCFYDKGDSAVEEWVAERAVKILRGKCNQVASGKGYMH